MAHGQGYCVLLLFYEFPNELLNSRSMCIAWAGFGRLRAAAVVAVAAKILPIITQQVSERACHSTKAYSSLQPSVVVQL